MEREHEALYELEDVEVDRVDAVDRPATGRKWLLLKSEEEDETVAIARELEMRVVRALETLAREAEERGGLSLSDDAVAALNELASFYGFDRTFVAAVPEAQAADESDSRATEPAEEVAFAAGAEGADAQAVEAAAADYPAPGYGYPDPSIWAAILEELKAIRALLEKGAMAKSQPAAVASRQPEPEARARQPQTRRWGEGLFVDVLFGS